MKNHFKISILITLGLLIALPFLSIKPAQAWTSTNVPIAIQSTRQYSPFDTRPTVRNITGSPDIRSPGSNGVFDPTASMPAPGTPTFANDGDNTTAADIGFPTTSGLGPGNFELGTFTKDTTLPPITSVDFLVTYSWDNTGTDVSDTYSFLINLGGSTTTDPTLVSNTVLLAPTNNAHPLATDQFINVARPGGGSWTWADIGTGATTLVFATALTFGGVSTPPLPDFFEYEVVVRVNTSTAGSLSTPSAHPLTLATDGNPTTFASVQGVYYFNGAVHLARFAKAPTATTAFSSIKWVDLKMAYTFPALGSGTYSIQAVVNGSAPVVLVPATSLAGPTSLSNTLAQTFQNLTDPRTGTKTGWTWNDINWLDIKIVFSGISPLTPPAFQINEVWLSVYPTFEGDGTTPVNYPLTGLNVAALPHMFNATSSGGIAGTTAIRVNDFIFVDIYLFNGVKIFGYQFNVTFNPAVLQFTTGFYTYYPWNTAAPTSFSNTAGWVSTAFFTFPGDTVGFTGNSPMARLYFKAIAKGSSVLNFAGIGTQSLLTDTLGNTIVPTFFNSSFNVVSVPEFPLGMGIVLALAPAAVIVFLWRTRSKRRVK